MKQALGQLPNAPLIYVLAQILFTRVPKMEDIWEDLHQRVFDSYPESEIERVEQFAMKTDGLEASKETRWHLFARDRRKGVILSSNALILHTTSYTTSKDFFADLGFVLGHLAEVLPSGIQVNRLGLRYIDLLLPRGELDIDRQVVGKLGILNFEPLGCKPMRFDRVDRYQTKIGGELVLRHRQTMGTDVLPGDLFPNILKPASLLEVPKSQNVMVGLLDFDHFLKADMPMELASIIDKFRQLQETTSAAFRKITTPAAMQVWEGTQ